MSNDLNEVGESTIDGLAHDRATTAAPSQHQVTATLYDKVTLTLLSIHFLLMGSVQDYFRHQVKLQPDLRTTESRSWDSAFRN